ncbi:MAG: 2-dehydropantoate 2-reductase [Acidimicrobiia bacterium]|nr:2-dehydropantoate 2-reductase [Acidimicrobiia bacterium]
MWRRCVLAGCASTVRGGDIQLPSVDVTDDPSAAAPADVVLFAVKLYDLASSLPLLPPLIRPETLVVPLQNGVEAVDGVTRAVGAGHTAGGTCYVSAFVAEPGVIRHIAMGRLLFGPLNGPAPGVLRELETVCEGAGFETVLSDRIQTEIWAKFVRLTAFSGMTTVTRSPVGVIAADPDLRRMATAALRESFAVAEASGVSLDASVVPSIVESYATMPFGTKSSMLEDLERGRRLELPFLSGKVAQLGQSLGVPTPTHQFITTVLGPFVNGQG